jgi:hypothetical protein
LADIEDLQEMAMDEEMKELAAEDLAVKES